MISQKYLQHLQNELQSIENDGLYKKERIITSQQSAEIEANGKKLLNSNLCETNGVLTLDCIFELNSNTFILN